MRRANVVPLLVALAAALALPPSSALSQGKLPAAPIAAPVAKTVAPAQAKSAAPSPGTQPAGTTVAGGKAGKTEAAGSNGTQTAPAQVAQPVAIKPEQVLYLIRSTLLSLHDAFRSGNYTVMRDLAAPAFRAANTPESLAKGFTDLRSKIDLSAVAYSPPALATAPTLDQNKMLRITGNFATQPNEIVFDLTFQGVDNQWRLFGISVSTRPAQTAAATPAPTPAPPAKK